MDNLQYKDETQNMAKVSLQKGITIHRPSWLSSRIWKYETIALFSIIVNFLNRRDGTRLILKKTHNETCAQFSVPTSLHLVSTVLAVQVKAKRCSTAFPKKKGNLGFHGKAVFRNLVKFYTTKAF